MRLVVGHDDKLPRATISHANNAESERAGTRNAESESAAPRNKPLWRSSLRRHARSVAQDVGMAVWRLDHVTNSGRSAGSTVKHDVQLTVDSLSHAGNAEDE